MGPLLDKYLCAELTFLLNGLNNIMLWSSHAHRITIRNVFSLHSFFPLTEGNLHTIQSLCPFLSKEEKKEFSAQCIPAFLGWTKEDLCSINGAFGHLAIFNSCLQTRSIDDKQLLHGILKIITSWRKQHEDIFLFSCNLSEASPEVLGLNIEIMRFLSLFLKYCSYPLAESEWDFIMCSMLAWLETASENQALYCVPLVQLFACVSFDLACDLSAFFWLDNSRYCWQSSCKSNQWMERIFL